MLLKVITKQIKILTYVIKIVTSNNNKKEPAPILVTGPRQRNTSKGIMCSFLKQQPKILLNWIWHLLIPHHRVHLKTAH